MSHELRFQNWFILLSTDISYCPYLATPSRNNDNLCAPEHEDIFIWYSHIPELPIIGRTIDISTRLRLVKHLKFFEW